MEERMVGGRRKCKTRWWEEGRNRREDGERKEEMEERMEEGRRKWKRGWWKKEEMEERMVGGRRK